MAKLVETIVRRNNSANITYVLKKYDDNTYKFTTLVLRSGCYVVASVTSGICVN
jgi:hypothetical protein